LKSKLRAKVIPFEYLHQNQALSASESLRDAAAVNSADMALLAVASRFVRPSAGVGGLVFVAAQLATAIDIC
jgi:hypothetical protein